MNSADAAGAAAASMDDYRGVKIGNVIDCEGGSLITDSYFTARAVDRQGKIVKEFKGEDRHMANFIDVIRSRKTADLYGPVDEGHISSALCHLGNISHRTGRATTPDALRDRIKSDPLLKEAVGRMQEHLGKNQVDLAKTAATLGVPLQIDSAKERFTGAGADAANAMLTRAYRAPFTVPKLA
jgi:hypothetical protein